MLCALLRAGMQPFKPPTKLCCPFSASFLYTQHRDKRLQLHPSNLITQHLV